MLCEICIDTFYLIITFLKKVHIIIKSCNISLTCIILVAIHFRVSCRYLKAYAWNWKPRVSLILGLTDSAFH